MFLWFVVLCLCHCDWAVGTVAWVCWLLRGWFILVTNNLFVESRKFNSSYFCLVLVLFLW